jgi:hypothetical protein
LYSPFLTHRLAWLLHVAPVCVVCGMSYRFRPDLRVATANAHKTDQQKKLPRVTRLLACLYAREGWMSTWNFSFSEGCSHLMGLHCSYRPEVGPQDNLCRPLPNQKTYVLRLPIHPGRRSARGWPNACILSPAPCQGRRPRTCFSTSSRRDPWPPLAS